MTKYNDLFVRDSLSDSGDIPYVGNVVYQCPDILPAGLTPIDNPAVYYTNNYSQFIGSDIVFGRYNYIYIRVKNLASQPVSGQVNLYYIPSNIFSLPRQWVNNRIPNINGTYTGTFNTAIAPNGIGVIDAPFYWNPPTMPSGYHYCLTAQIITAQHPNPIPINDNIFDYEQWIRSNGGAAFRNINITNPSGQSVTQWVLDMANPEPQPNLFIITATCTNCPAGSVLTLVSPSPGPNPPLNDSETINSNYQIVTAATNLPANFDAQIIATYTPSGPSTDASIVFKTYLSVSPADLNRVANPATLRSLASLGIATPVNGVEASDPLLELSAFTWYQGMPLQR